MGTKLWLTYYLFMNLLGKKILYNFKKKHLDVESGLNSWEAEVEEATWSTPHDLKRKYPKASLLGGGQTIFDICGNAYRLLTKISYKNQTILVLKVDTHEKYNKWNIK